MIAMIGPTSAFSIRRKAGGPDFRNNVCHQAGGTSVAMNPAIRKPPSTSFQSIIQSIMKACAIAVHFASCASCVLVLLLVMRAMMTAAAFARSLRMLPGFIPHGFRHDEFKEERRRKR